MLSEYENKRERAKFYRAAMIVAAIYNVNMDPKKGKKAITPEQILGETKGDMRETAKALTEVFGGEIGDGVV